MVTKLQQDVLNNQQQLCATKKSTVERHNKSLRIAEYLDAQGRDSGNDYSFPVPFPFLKLNDNDKKSFLFGYPKNKNLEHLQPN